jgi:hypothetical protein
VVGKYELELEASLGGRAMGVAAAEAAAVGVSADGREKGIGVETEGERREETWESEWEGRWFGPVGWLGRGLGPVGPPAGVVVRMLSPLLLVVLATRSLPSRSTSSRSRLPSSCCL